MKNNIPEILKMKFRSGFASPSAFLICFVGRNYWRVCKIEPMDTHGFASICIANLALCNDIQVNLWISGGIYGYPWQLRDNHGNPKIFWFCEESRMDSDYKFYSLFIYWYLSFSYTQDHDLTDCHRFVSFWIR